MIDFEAALDAKYREHKRSLMGSALVCTMLANINRDQKRRRKPYDVADLFPELVEDQPNQKKAATERQMLTLGKMLAASTRGLAKPTNIGYGLPRRG